MNVDKIESLISKKTKAIFVVHYGGSCMNLEKVLKKMKNMVYGYGGALMVVKLKKVVTNLG